MPARTVWGEKTVPDFKGIKQPKFYPPLVYFFGGLVRKEVFVCVWLLVVYNVLVIHTYIRGLDAPFLPPPP